MVETLEKRAARLRGRRLSAYRQHAAAVRSATEALDAILATIDSQLQQLEKWSTDPIVLVRNTPGPAVVVFHGADAPCGKVNPVMVRQGRFEEMRLGEAVEKGLRACTACASELRPGEATA